MPFDASRSWESMTAAERCRAFADELDAWEKMGAVFPDGEEWNFIDCDRCAMGYAVATGRMKWAHHKSTAAFLGIAEKEALRIFCRTCRELGKLNPTPSDIAGLLREHADTLDG